MDLSFCKGNISRDVAEGNRLSQIFEFVPDRVGLLKSMRSSLKGDSP